MIEAYNPDDPLEHEMAARTRAFLLAHANALSPECIPGHVTGSAWILDTSRRLALMTHHRKLDRWFQLGGHLEPGESVFAGAWREAREESGLASVRPVAGESIFDLDIHTIPARANQPEHDHYDIRFLFEADAAEPLSLTAESRALAWIPVREAHLRNSSESILRMVRKTLARWP